MKTSELTREGFKDLSQVELSAIGGEGFAYDVGRFLRFVTLTSGGFGGYAEAVADIVVLDVLDL